MVKWMKKGWELEKVKSVRFESELDEKNLMVEDFHFRESENSKKLKKPFLCHGFSAKSVNFYL
jgi:hypothetical protein